MKTMKTFFVLTMAVIFMSSLIVSVQAAPKLKTKHIGFILKVDNKAEWKESLSKLAEELNSNVEEIASNLSKKEMRNADLFKFSYEIISKGKFKTNPSMTYEIAYGEKDSSVNIIYHKQEDRKITLIFPKDKTDRMLNSLKEIFLSKDLGLDNYLEK